MSQGDGPVRVENVIEPSNKRFKVGSINKNKLVDLTIDDSDESDDDIVITGSREVRTPDDRGLPKNLATSVSQNTNLYRPPNFAISNQTNAPLKLERAPLNFERLPSNGIKDEDEDDDDLTVLHEIKRPVISNEFSDFVDGKPPVIYDAEKFYSEKDLENKKAKLQDHLNGLKKRLENETSRSAEIIQKVQALNQRKERLRRLGTSENDTTLKEIVLNLKKLSNESRNTHHSISTIRQKVFVSKNEFLNFNGKIKPQISTMLKQRPAPTQQLIDPRAHPAFQRLFTPLNLAQVPARLAEIEKVLRIPIPVNFRDELNKLRLSLKAQVDKIRQANGIPPNPFGVHRFGANNDDINDDEEDFTRMMQQQQQYRRQLENNDPLGANIYNTNNGEDQSNLKDLLASVKKVEEEKEGESQTPENLTVNLLTHQRLGLHWLELAEDDQNKCGGILADDMGLGKTVQLISLILSHRPPENEEHKTTLIVCPVALMNQWQAEIEMKVKEAEGLKIFIFHSLKQKYSFEQLKQYDIVITSFTTLANEYKKHVHDILELSKARSFVEMTEINKKKEKHPTSYHSPFFTSDAKFYRTILDEVQWIKNKLTHASLAVTGINSHYRWCLSGTPLQNRIDELYPYLRFLRIKPYNKESNFRIDILLPLKSKDYDDYDKDKAMHKVRVLLKAILLRREKTSLIDGKPILQLPGKEIRIENLDITTNKDEASFYYSMEASSAEKVRAILNGPKAKGNYSNILTLLLRLRQAAIHSDLVRIGERKKGILYDDGGQVSFDPKKAIKDMCNSALQLKEQVVNRINEVEKEDDGNRFKCPICLDSPPDENWTFFGPCGHGVCTECVDSFFEQRADTDIDVSYEKQIAKCTDCGITIKKTNLISYDIFDRICNRKQTKEMVQMIKEKDLAEELKNQETDEIDENKLRMSPKTAKAIELIQDILAKNPNDKIIIFSQFTTLFHLFAPMLKKNSIDPLLYLGSMNATKRTEIIKMFYRDDNSRVLLISMKAGNVGLTLTCANHVIIMDPFWNPYVEEQAQDRAYRIGQFKPVTVYRILVGETVEDRIMELQKKKKELIESAMDEKGRNFVSGLNRQEIGMLFGIRDL